MALALDNIPGYREALNAATAAEYESRGNAWWNLTYDIGGLTVRTMTVRDYDVLIRVQCPILLRAVPSPEELLVFLWLLSPEVEKWHDPTGWRGMFPVLRRLSVRAFRRKARKLLKLDEIAWQEAAWKIENPDKPFTIPEDSAFSKAIAGCLSYLDTVFMDRPAGLKSNGLDSGLCYLTDWFCKLQREFGLPTAEIQQMPLPQVFARLKEITLTRRDHAPLFNARRDQLNQQVMAALRSGMTEADLMAGKLQFRTN